jgi:beta-galactosidase
VKLLNEKWGTKFWSAEYNSFDEIDLPSSTVTEPFPSQLLDFYRFSSDQVVSYNKLQTEIIRRYSPNRFITHNFMGFFFQFDHYKVMKELDFSSWDSYPLGFTDTTLGLGEMFSDEIKIRYAKTGHPDIASFHHDLYSSLTANGRNRNELENRGKFWIMEQQPGPVNWGDHNPSPAKGMVRLWSWEAFAHHASVVSYFRWRQVPFAQEQMHSGLLLSNDEKADGYFEAESVINEIDKLKTYFESRNETKSSVGMIFDYTTQWALKIKPQGKGFQYVKLFYSMYSKLRALGVDVDILKPGNDLTQYSLVVVPSLPIVTQEALTSFKNYKEKNPKGLLVFGPRSGSITENFEIPPNLAPGKLSEILSIKIPKVESFRDGAPLKASVDFDQKSFPYTIWKEVIQLKQNENIEILGKFEDGTPAIVSDNHVEYFGFWPSTSFLDAYVRNLLKKTNINHFPNINEDIRISTRKGMKFVVNYGPVSQPTPTFSPNVKYLMGGETTPAHGVTIYIQE